MARIVAVCTSDKMGVRKHAVSQGMLLADKGVEGDAHCGTPKRQVSLLAAESIDIMKAKGVKVSHGVFAENIVTEGIELPKIPIGTKIRLGESAIVEVTQIGKECHSHCEIYRQAGDCIMPREGIFVRVLKGGPVKAGDEIEILGASKTERKGGANKNV